MAWGMVLSERIDLERRLARLQEVPVLLQFRPMNLCPGLHEASLADWKVATQALQRVDREHSCVLLVVRVEVRTMVRAAGLDEHPDDDPEESREFWHLAILPRRSSDLVGLTPALSR